MVKPVDMALASIVAADFTTVPLEETEFDQFQSEEQLHEVMKKLEEQMREAAKQFEFERAARLRDRLRALKHKDIGGLYQPAALPPEPLAELAAVAARGETAASKSARESSGKRRKRRK